VPWPRHCARTLRRERITDRLRAYDSAVYSHTVEGMTILEGIDPDGLRVIVAYPTPRRLPRTATSRLNGVPADHRCLSRQASRPRKAARTHW
jgi:hypothetical protein